MMTTMTRTPVEPESATTAPTRTPASTALVLARRPVLPTTRGPIERLAPLLLSAAGVVMLPALAVLIDRDAIGGLGLAGILPVWAWFGIAAAVSACMVEVIAPDPRPRILVLLTGVLSLCTFGLPSVVEPGARLGVSWTHLGFVEAIASAGGRVPAGVDSRFSWAGFFSQWAWIDDATGGLPLDIIVRWAPPAIALLWATGVYAIARRLLDGRRAPWIATWLFLGLNWIEQDYFSPQATAMLLALAVLVLAIGPLATRRAPLTDPVDPPAARLRALLRPGRWWPPARLAALRAPHPATPPAQVLVAWLVAALAIAAMATAHQLTPFALLAQLVVLTIAGRVWGGRGLVLVLLLCVVGWLVLGGREFWLNQLALATGDVGNASGSFAVALSDRLVGDPGQLVVKAGRVVLALGTFVLAAAGAWVRWRRTGDVVWLVVALVPAGLVLVQSYGGEVLLRVLLYGLPLFAVLGVEALRVVVRRAPRTGRVVLAIGAVALFATLVVVRGGNDAYVALRPQEIAVTRAVLDQAPYGSTVLPLTSQAPVQVARVGEVDQTPRSCEELLVDPVRCALADRPYAIWSLPTMDAEGSVLDGLPRGWSVGAMEAIAATGQYRITYQDGLYIVLVRTS